MTSNLFARRTVYIFVLASILLVLAPSTASSQGIVESLLGVFQRPARSELPPPAIAYALPTPLPDPLSESRSIRDVQAVLWSPIACACATAISFRCRAVSRCRRRISAARSARRPRPRSSAATASINASAADGSRYANLDTALLYRTRAVNNCTCNGRDAFGVARLDVASDPTLRAGDIVAINGGFAAYTGSKSAARQNAEFTPIGQYSGVSNDTRRKLSETKVLPARTGSSGAAQSAPTSSKANPPRASIAALSF